LALIVDACDYFRHLREVIIATRQQLMLIGWDFDLEIEMLPGESDKDGLAPDGLPNKIGPFLEKVIERNTDLHIYILKWNGAVLVAPGRLAPGAALAAFGSARIHFALDGHHPFGACHHQKIVVADDSIAFCGGIDMTENRWDTSEHLPNDPRRLRKDGSPSEPWHDATTAVSGPAAAALGDLARQRWKRAQDETLEEPSPRDAAVWPDDLSPNATDIEVGIARTQPPFDGSPLINEIEKSLLHAIETAESSLYIESQYFTGDSVCEALEKRLKEKGGPEIVIINPEYALSPFEDDAMHEQRDRKISQLSDADREERFRMYYPVTKAEQSIYVHAKIFIADQKILHIGSANMNNRSMGSDTECNMIIEGQEELIAGFRTRLLSEHLAVSAEEFDETHKERGGLIAAVEALNSTDGRGLRKMIDRPSSLRGNLLADTQIMDPRYAEGDTTSAGQGIRPRHIAALIGTTVAGYLGWRGWRKRK
jgi:phospholipase D1/2